MDEETLDILSEVATDGKTMPELQDILFREQKRLDGMKFRKSKSILPPSKQKEDEEIVSRQMGRIEQVKAAMVNLRNNPTPNVKPMKVNKKTVVIAKGGNSAPANNNTGSEPAT